MPISFILAIIFALITAACWFVQRASVRATETAATDLAEAQRAYDENNTYVTREALDKARQRAKDRSTPIPFGALAVPAAFVVLFMLFATIVSVPAKSIGVVTAGGKPVGQMDSGWHLKAPWEKVTRLDGTIQTNSAIGSEGDGPDSEDYDIGDVRVRLGNESLATVRYTVRWRIKLDTAQALYSEYRGMAKIRESLVTRETLDALNKVLASYDPLAEIKGDTDAGTKSFGDYADEVKTIIQNSNDGQRIEILSVSLPLVKYDKGTQKKLDAYQQQVAATRVAEELEATNKAQARANRALSESISNDPNILVKQCLDTLDTLADKGKTPAAGFSCWPGKNIDGLIVR